MLTLQVTISTQLLQVFAKDKIISEYVISTAKNGPGEMFGSEQTPRGWHLIRAKIGASYPLNSVFVGRRPTGQIYNEELRLRHPERDWILTRIFWLSGTEQGKNRLGKVDTMRRYIYIHGTSDEASVGTPASKGCIRMRNSDIITLFDQIPVYTRINIQE